MSRSRSLLALAAGVALAFVSCQTITEQVPTEPTPTELAPITIPVIMPVPQPTPTPTATPNPSPSATPTPTPAPPPPSGAGCSLPPSRPSNPVCTDDSPALLGQVERAITRVTQEHPEIFDFGDKKCDNCYLVKNVSRFIAEVLRALAAEGVCTFWDGEEIGAKNSNDFSEQYDILLASDHIRRAPGSYRGVCRPALF